MSELAMVNKWVLQQVTSVWQRVPSNEETWTSKEQRVKGFTSVSLMFTLFKVPSFALAAKRFVLKKEWLL